MSNQLLMKKIKMKNGQGRKNSWNRRSKEEIANIHQHWTANKSLIISHIFTQKCKYTHYLVGNYWEKKIVKKHALRKWNGKSSTYWNILPKKCPKKSFSNQGETSNSL